MDKIKKLKIQSVIGFALFGLALLFSAGWTAVAYYGDAPQVVVEGDYIEAPAVETPVQEEMFGGSGGVFQTDWYKVGNRVTWIKSGQFADATTTLFSFLNPVDYGKATSTSDATYNAANHEVSTSTVVSINLDITGVSTSSAVVICGGASDQYSTPTYDLLNLTLATSTLGVYNNNQATTTDGIGVVGTGSATQILLTHDYNYFNCVITNYGDADDLTGFTGDSNTFDGYWSVEVMKNLQ